MYSLLRVVLLSSLCSAISPSFAMQCRAVDPDRIAAEAEVAFVGKAISVTPTDYGGGVCWKADRGNNCGAKVVVFEVVKSLKGQRSGQVRVLAEDGCYCLGGYFTAGREYLVVASRNSTPVAADVLAKNVCWGTGPAEGAFALKVINRLSTASP